MTTQPSFKDQNSKVYFLPWCKRFSRIGSISLAFAATLLVGSTAHAATTDTWVGATGSDWDAAGNWSTLKPGSADTALFNSNISSVANAVADQSISSISFGTGAGSITIGSTGGNKLLFTTGGTTQLLNTLTGTGLTETINSPIVISSGAGAATYTFSNAYTDNTSKLVVGGAISGGTTGTTAVTLSSVSTGANTISGSISNGSSSALSIIKSGAGTWALSGNNSYTGGTTVSGGTLDINSATAVGTGTLAIGVGVTIDNTSGAPVTLTTGNTVALNTNAFTFGGSNNLNLGTGAVNVTQPSTVVTLNGTNSVLTLGTGNNTGSGSNVTVTANGVGNTLVFGGYNISNGAGAKNLTVNGSANVAITGAVVDSSSTGVLSTVTYSGSGKLTLSGANTYTGATKANSGMIQFAKEVSLYNDNTASWTAANILDASGATLAFNVGGAGEFTAADLNTLLTNISVTSSASQGLQAGSKLGFDTTNAVGGTFTQGNVIANSTGTRGGAVGVTKLGTGTLELNKANTYTGGTIVTAGNLKVNNTGTGSATGTGSVDVLSGASLSGGNNTGALTAPGAATLGIFASGVKGIISGPVTIESGAHLAPGNGGVGTLTTANLTLNLGSIADYEFNTTANDFTAVTATLTLNGAGFNLYQEGTTTAFDAVGTYDLLSYGTLAGSLANLSVLNQQAGFSYTFINDTADGMIQLQIGEVPEPGTWAMMLGGLALLVILQRRRREI